MSKKDTLIKCEIDNINYKFKLDSFKFTENIELMNEDIKEIISYTKKSKSERYLYNLKTLITSEGYLGFLAFVIFLFIFASILTYLDEREISKEEKELDEFIKKHKKKDPLVPFLTFMIGLIGAFVLIITYVKEADYITKKEKRITEIRESKTYNLNENKIEISNISSIIVNGSIDFRTSDKITLNGINLIDFYISKEEYINNVYDKLTCNYEDNLFSCTNGIKTFKEKVYKNKILIDKYYWEEIEEAILMSDSEYQDLLKEKDESDFTIKVVLFLIIIYFMCFVLLDYFFFSNKKRIAEKIRKELSC